MSYRFPFSQTSEAVLASFLRFLSLCLSKVIAILPSIRKTFNLAPLNTSDIKSYSIVCARARGGVGKAVNNPLRFSLLGQKGNRAGSGANEIRGDVLGQTIGIAVVSGDFFSRSPTRRLGISWSRKKRRACICLRQYEFALISFSSGDRTPDASLITTLIQI